MIMQYQKNKGSRCVCGNNGFCGAFSAIIQNAGEVTFMQMCAITALLFFLAGSAAAQTSATGSEGGADEQINLKYIQLTAKKHLTRRKIRRKGEVYVTGRGVDYMHDDKIDKLKLIVEINNRNKIPLTNYSVKVEVYVKSVTQKRPLPELYKEFSKKFEEVQGKKKASATFSTSTVYDKTEDVYQSDNGNYTGTVYRTPPFGKSFFGYRVKLLDSDGNVIKTVLWPSALKKALAKIEKQKKK